jgi:vancomycin resistance protein YoaR
VTAIKFTEQPEANPKIAVEIDPTALGSILETTAKDAVVPVKNAELRYYDGQVKVVSAEQPGIALDVEQSTAAILAALRSGNRTAELVRKDVQPEVTAAMASSVVIRDTLASAQTSYAGSIANRKYNVELAVNRVNGALIPPGGTFSFTGAVDAVDLENGYKVGYGIVGASNGSVSTVPSVGGGICQVSTTTFQAAFWAGMPIVERSWHFYWIPLYGQPPSGLTGLDATVDTDVGLDFKFKNTSPNWLAVVASADGNWVRVELKGINTGWTVKVDDPVITNRVKADTTMHTRETDQLSAGSSVLVEHAEDGFDVSITRRVYEGEKLIDDATLKSHYAPSANVTLVGTG